MLTLSEFRSLAREIKESHWWLDCFSPGGNGEKQLEELLLEYTDLSSEDDELIEKLDREIFSKIKTE